MKYAVLFLLFINICAYAQEEKESFWARMARYHDVIQSMVQGSLDSRGLSHDTLFRPNVASYDSIHQSINKTLQKSACTDLDCDSYQEDFSEIVNSHLGKALELRVLRNKESFELRKDLFNRAKKSIHILVWAIIDDQTGAEFKLQMLEALKRNPELDIKIILDGNMSNLKGRKVLKEIDKKSEGKIKVMKWKSRRYRANGNHRKLIIIDQEHVIVGGMNIGNEYSHYGKADKWRDLDIYLRGPKSGEVAERQFVEIWNKQIKEFPKLEKKIGTMEEIKLTKAHDQSNVVFVDQHPGSAVKDSYHNIHTGLVKLFRDAKESIDIENAYFIMDPIIKKEIEATVKRGVEVRIFTNSDKSVDETIVSMPIMNSARDAVIMGAKVYLRRGTTLHSKYMVIDRKISVVGSFNLHPRSLRFDAENVAVVSDLRLASELTDYFEEGISTADFYDDPKAFKIDWNLIGLLTQSFYFDFL